MLRTKYSEEIEKQMKAYFDTLNEKDRRGYAAIEAMKLGHGGQNYISSVLGCHFQTVMAGINEITNGTETPVSYTHLRAHETRHDLVCRLLLEKKKTKTGKTKKEMLKFSIFFF